MVIKYDSKEVLLSRLEVIRQRIEELRESLSGNDEEILWGPKFKEVMSVINELSLEGSQLEQILSDFFVEELESHNIDAKRNIHDRLEQIAFVLSDLSQPIECEQTDPDYEKVLKEHEYPSLFCGNY